MASSSGTLVHSLGHNTLGTADIAIQSIFLALCFIAVALRLWSRRLQWVSSQVNDWLIMGATFFMVGRYVVEIMLVVLCGLGLHSTEVTQVGGTEVMIQFIELTYTGDLLWITVVFLIQVSILHYYVRSFGHCGGRKMLHTAINASEMILSFFILALPVPLTWRMPLSRARKFSLVGMQILGLVAIVIIAISTKLEFDLDSEDPTFSSASKSFLLCIAPLLGIIAACLPILSPAVEMIFRTTILSSPSHNSTSDPQTFSRYWNPTALSGMRLDEPEMPLVTVHQPSMTKVGYLAPGHIQITSDWEIHSSRGSARLDRSPVRRS
ncbi:uncharacterized protein N7529_000258 [Penicillium soppii]|uniref:uncharacterized protein n=1 Tax=Penicillium soppii TaxID=69789 RepID=UPI002548C4C1|nr:uncharacterized protein N7529_000258 [Penicillium soppii]KAJ5881586.1 hypothetical protein N7529_000258 [Penicillium soppii]